MGEEPKSAYDLAMERLETADPAERDKAGNEYRISRKRIEDDRDRAIESIHSGRR